MNVGVINLEFEVGYPIEGCAYGKGFDGRAEIDANKNVVRFSVEGFTTGVKDRSFDVPFHPAPYTDIEVFSLAIAHEIEAKYDREIDIALYEWSVSIAEKQFEAAE